jgi:ABC-type polysaccharide/polyol phosphate export permease
MSFVGTISSADLRRRVGKASIAVGNEVVKGLRHGWAERTQIVIELPLFVSFMLMVSFIVGHGDQVVATGRMSWNLDRETTSWLFLGVSLYTFLYLLIQKLFWRLLAEIQTGTLEQTYLSPLPSWVHTVAGRAVAATAEAAIVVGVMYAVARLVVRLDLTWRFDVLIPLALGLVGSTGFALIIGGLTLRWKRIEMFNDLVLLIFMFFSGVIIAVDRLPSFAASISPYLYLTHVTEGVRQLMLYDQSLGLAGIGGYGWTVATSVGWFLAGFAIFQLCEQAAKRSGSLSRY